MTVKDALLAIAARALAQRDEAIVQPTRPNDRANKLDKDGPKFFIGSKCQSSGIGK